VFRELFGRLQMNDEPWACDASLYDSRRYAGADWLLVGDAASTIDPLSSFGVKKALISAWMAAVVVNTCLKRPEMADAAIGFYNERERQAYADHARQAAAQFAEMTPRFPAPFWQTRSVLTNDLQLYDRSAMERAHQELVRSPKLRLRLREPLRTERVPAIAAREVVQLDRLVIPGLPPTVEYVQGVNLVQLARIADQYDEVPALYDAYNQANAVVALPNLISALAFLVAVGVLRT
jgi:Tryptophan halogenase